MGTTEGNSSAQRFARVRKPVAKVVDPNNGADPALSEHQKAVDERNGQQPPS